MVIALPGRMAELPLSLKPKDSCQQNNHSRLRAVFNWIKILKLTAKQEAFCLAYLETGNASEAYRRAYKPNKMTDKSVNEKASRMLAMVKIRSRLDELNAAAVSAAVMTRQEALERLSRFARIDLADLVEFGAHTVGHDEETGQPIIQSVWAIKNSVLQDPKKLAAISELSATKDGIKIKTHSPLQAIQQLAKMQGWESATKHEVSGPDGKPMEVVHMTPEAIRQVMSKDDC